MAGVVLTQHKVAAADECTIGLRVLRVHELATLADQFWHLADTPLDSLLQYVIDAFGSVVGPVQARRLHILS